MAEQRHGAVMVHAYAPPTTDEVIANPPELTDTVIPVAPREMVQEVVVPYSRNDKTHYMTYTGKAAEELWKWEEAVGEGNRVGTNDASLGYVEARIRAATEVYSKAPNVRDFNREVTLDGGKVTLDHHQLLDAMAETPGGTELALLALRGVSAAQKEAFNRWTREVGQFAKLISQFLQELQEHRASAPELKALRDFAAQVGVDCRLRPRHKEDESMSASSLEDFVKENAMLKALCVKAGERIHSIVASERYKGVGEASVFGGPAGQRRAEYFSEELKKAGKV